MQPDTSTEARVEMERREAATKLIEQGRAQLDRGELEAAIRTFDEATSLDEQNAAAWNDLAVALYQAGESQMAIGCLYTALRVDPTFADAAINLATLLENAGRPADGIPGLRGVLFHDPEQEDVREMLAGMGVGTIRPVALVAVDAELDTYRVIDACLSEWQYLTTPADPSWVAAFGDVEETGSWVKFLAAVRPATIVVDPAHPTADRVIAAAERLEAKVSLLGTDLPDGTPLVDLARALTTSIPEARETWEDVTRPAPPITVSAPVTHIADTINLLDRLANQTLPPGLFEVILADRAWGEPATSLVEIEEIGFDLNIIRLEGKGLAEARQATVDAARGTWMLFYDEETRPAPDAVAKHLGAQATSTTTEAILGDFRMHPNLVDNSLRTLIDTTNILWAQPELIDGTVHGGAAFRANNTSVPIAAIRAVNGFDPIFSAGCEDTDLGVRMELELGVNVRFDGTIRAHFDFPFQIRDLQMEQLIRGWACFHLASKHEDPRFLVDPSAETLDGAWFGERRRLADERADQAQDLARRVQNVCTIEEPYRKTGAAEHMDPIVRVIGMQAFNRGIAIAHAGMRLEDERLPGSLSAVPTPVVIRPGGDIGTTLGSLACTDGDLVVFVPEDVGPLAGLDIRRGGLPEAMAMNAPVVAWIEAGTQLDPDWRIALLDTLESWPDHGVAVPIVTAGPVHNRPRSTPVGIAHRDVLEKLGEGAQAALDSTALRERVAEVGYRLCIAEACSVERAVIELEKTA